MIRRGKAADGGDGVGLCHPYVACLAALCIPVLLRINRCRWPVRPPGFIVMEPCRKNARIQGKYPAQEASVISRCKSLFSENKNISKPCDKLP